MPVILVKLNFKVKFYYLYKDIKCFVIIFSYFFFLFFILIKNSLTEGGYAARGSVSAFTEKVSVSYPLALKPPFRVVNKRITYNSILVKRYYSTSKKADSGLKDLNLGSAGFATKEAKVKSTIKTLSSPEAKPYVDLYKGRGVPKFEPEWVKDNGKERSPFGASWAKDKLDRLALPDKYLCDYRNILDPYNNKQSIKEVCKGNRVVYIWTYLPTGICLVGSSSNSLERVLSYFEKKYLFLDMRRGVQFLADYGFKDIQLTIFYYNKLKFTIRDIKIIEAYYINELNSSLNSQKYVYLPPEPLESVGGLHISTFKVERCSNLAIISWRLA